MCKCTDAYKEGLKVMVISASRRTDIPTYYSEWFFNRLRDEYVLVRNPMNIHQIGRINLSPNVVDGIVLWTKIRCQCSNDFQSLKNIIIIFSLL